MDTKFLGAISGAAAGALDFFAPQFPQSYEQILSGTPRPAVDPQQMFWKSFDESLAAYRAAQAKKPKAQAVAPQQSGVPQQSTDSVQSLQSTPPKYAPMPAGPGDDGLDRSSREAFVASILPMAREAERRTGIPAALMVAINLNEQGWQKPAPGNNYFGIKGRGTGPVATWEDYGNGPVQTTAEFRSYASPVDSYADFGDFLAQNPRYAKALEVLKAGDPVGFIKAVHAAGYATDPAWSDKILSIAKEVDPRFGKTPEERWAEMTGGD